MPIDKINYDNKEDYSVNPVADKYKVIASDMNALKTAVNALIDAVALLRKPTILTITNSSFRGDNYDNTKLVNKVANVDFMVFTNDGDGVLLKPYADGEYDYGYVYNPSLGRIIATPDDYIILLFEAVS